MPASVSPWAQAMVSAMTDKPRAKIAGPNEVWQKLRTLLHINVQDFNEASQQNLLTFEVQPAYCVVIRAPQSFLSLEYRPDKNRVEYHILGDRGEYQFGRQPDGSYTLATMDEPPAAVRPEKVAETLLNLLFT